MTRNADSFCIRRYADLGHEDSAVAVAKLERIFFAASKTQSFTSDAARKLFRYRWFGHYLGTYAHLFLVAFRADEAVGYLAGCDVALSADPYFVAEQPDDVFGDLSAQYPAHLHINLDPRMRSRGYGSRLVGEFVRHCASRGLPGVHIVTGDGGRNVQFYHRCGFTCEVRRAAQGRKLLFMGRRLA